MISGSMCSWLGLYAHYVVSRHVCIDDLVVCMCVCSLAACVYVWSCLYSRIGFLSHESFIYVKVISMLLTTCKCYNNIHDV